jgi:hypothetical protein
VAAIEMCTDHRWSADQADAWLKLAGTDPRYTGLKGLPHQLTPPTPAEIERIPADFPPVTPISSLAQIMVDVDARFDNLKLAKTAGWAIPKGHPDVEPVHEAVMLVEHFREAARLGEAKKRGSEFKRYMHDAESAAIELEESLRGKKTDRISKSIERSAATCAACHERYRDRPGSH